MDAYNRTVGKLRRRWYSTEPSVTYHGKQGTLASTTVFWDFPEMLELELRLLVCANCKREA